MKTSDIKMICTLCNLLFTILYDRPRGLSGEDTAMQRRIDIWIEVHIFEKTIEEIAGFDKDTQKFYSGIVTDITGRLRGMGVVE